MKKLTMVDRIRRHLLDYGSITFPIAYQEYGTNRLSEYIRQLRLEMNIKSVWKKGKNKYGEPTHYVIYELER